MLGPDRSLKSVFHVHTHLVEFLKCMWDRRRSLLCGTVLLFLDARTKWQVGSPILGLANPSSSHTKSHYYHELSSSPLGRGYCLKFGTEVPSLHCPYHSKKWLTSPLPVYLSSTLYSFNLDYVNIILMNEPPEARCQELNSWIQLLPPKRGIILSAWCQGRDET